MSKSTTKKTAAKKTTAPKATAGDTLGTKVTEGDEQHPALAGDPGEEVAARSQDITDAETSDVHRKDYVVLRRDWEGTIEKDDAHLANIEAMRQAMIGQGLRPTADGKFVGSAKHPDGVSLVLSYEVAATPAVIASDYEVAHAHVTLDDQHAAEAEVAESGEEK
jgi:hypothetical protein